MFVQPVVKEESQHRRRQNADHHLAPDRPGVSFLPRGLLRGKWIQFMKIEKDYRHDGAQLNHYEKHFLERVGRIEPDKLIHQDHMSGAADGKPFRNPFHDT
ncbi:hypothetical protein SDC9_199509 [bioreactor metagenome]|uniref:Uncharacterized protein n=1 Tax=bioreactor metagenome TaxID=1076179 RepID=A0A645IN77_9ZZZZ